MKSVKGGTNKLMALFKNKEDQDFVKRLFLKTIANHNINNQIINEMSLNWEPERIAKVDKIIMEIAMTEFAEFPLIPIPVSMNEYIDMAKYYSTENSNTFINGVLDNAVTIMKEKGLINKKGIGLVEKLEELENVNEDAIDDENSDEEEDEIFDEIYGKILENDDL